ncbi:MAG: DEAD/DEAH box helicase [Spirochaetaceae bacterium]|jgi:ATP-dependent Lhr-like helicase|nr:DEAD/DEAH box helicase [Spirochaetaceae bacterium]
MSLPFHPLVAAWFSETYGRPTAVQEEAWPLITAGKDILAIAPTGSGKTLTAFLAAISRFIDGTWDPEKCAVLYVSPLKALNEDIRRNLVEPIEELKRRAGEGSPVFRIRAETRSGDTPQSERRRFLLHPPSILAVTLESLAIILLNPQGREVLSHVKYLIIDEVHAVMGTKRGAFLSCQIDRLQRITGRPDGTLAHDGTSERAGASFQRVALSATVNPLELAAEFAGGLVPGKNGAYTKRPLVIVAPPAEKKIRFTVEFPLEAENIPHISTAAGHYGPRYAVLAAHILERISVLNRTDRKGTLLVFTDSRRRAERIAFVVNATAGERLALCHHGSLSKELRRDVEQSLVQGAVPCVVATSSLELGLDIGDVDEVLLAGTPSSCARALQRIGRSGHGVGEESRGFLIPFHGMDLLMGAVMAGAVADREIEAIRPVKNPLDILAQTALALCAEQPRAPEELYNIIRGFSVFSGLARSSFDQVIAMLTGKYFPAQEENGLRLRELKPRLYHDTTESSGGNSAGKLYPAEGTLALLYTSGGVIPSRGLYSLRLQDGTKIGELDEEFVWERRTGDSFDFGARSWSITEIGSEAVIVTPRREAADYQPFWKADTVFRSAELCRRTLDFFDAYNKSALVPNSAMLGTEAADSLGDFLAHQRKAQGNIPLPDHKNIPVEIIDKPAQRPDACQILFHTFRGGAVNYPLAMALSSVVEEKTLIRCEAVPDDNAVLLQLPRIAAEAYSGKPDLLPLIKDCVTALASGGENYFKKRLEASGIFGAAFREAAERSMILPRGMYGRRIPLWVMRQRAKRLYDRVAAYGDFPVITEAWRSCLADSFDMEGFRSLLEDIGSGTVNLRFFRSVWPSPFARNLSWMETNSFMYEYDERKDLPGSTSVKAERKSGIGGGSLSDKAIADALSDPSLRPAIKAAAASSFAARQRREIPGYAPEDALSLSQWVKDRIAIPLDEWGTLITALPSPLQEQLAADASLGGRLRTLTLSGAALPVVIHAGTAIAAGTATADETVMPGKTSAGTNTAAKTAIPGKTAAVSEEAGLLCNLGEWIRFQGPLVPERVAAVFGCTRAEAEDALDALVDTEDAVRDVNVEGSGEHHYCDAENYELLLRLARKKARPQIKERPASLLVPFVALRQGLIENPAITSAANAAILSGGEEYCLSCYPAPVRLWETEIFPARIKQYRPEKLDSLLKDSRLVWFGAGRERSAFAAPEELELADLSAFRKEHETTSALVPLLAEICAGYRNFWEIKDALESLAENAPLNNNALPGNDAANTATAIWEAAWQGRLSSDTWEGIRRGIERGFCPEKDTPSSLPKKMPPVNVTVAKLPGVLPAYRGTGRSLRQGQAHIPRALRERWREGAPVPGRMFSLDTDSSGVYEFSALEREELNCERVRLLLRRWGILCRPLLETESLFSWTELLPAMRRMELAGELVTGRFFEGIDSLQFASPSIAEELEAVEAAAGMTSNAGNVTIAGSAAAGTTAPVYWFNAADPASPAGWNIAGLDPRLPARNITSRLCFRGKDLAAVSSKSGKELELFVGEDDPDIGRILAFLSLPRTRACHPVKKITLEMINGNPAAESPHTPLLAEMGFIADREKLLLW